MDINQHPDHIIQQIGIEMDTQTLGRFCQTCKRIAHVCSPTLEERWREELLPYLPVRIHVGISRDGNVSPGIIIIGDYDPDEEIVGKVPPPWDEEYYYEALGQDLYYIYSASWQLEDPEIVECLLESKKVFIGVHVPDVPKWDDCEIVAIIIDKLRFPLNHDTYDTHTVPTMVYQGAWHHLYDYVPSI